MNPKDNMYDSVAIKNITQQTRIYHYNYSEDKTDYVLNPGEVKYYARFLADHIAEKIIDDYINENERYSMTNKEHRDKIRAMVVGNVVTPAWNTIPTPELLAQQQADELNKPVVEPTKPEVVEVVEPAPFGGMEGVVETVNPSVTEEQIISYATNLGMDVNGSKFQELMKSQKPEELAIALGMTK